MSGKPAGYHSRKIRELARDYTAKGYQVVVEPGELDTPVFLARLGYHPDLIATRDDERLIIEVTTSPEISRRKVLNRVAEVVDEKPDWELVLVLSNPKKAEPDDDSDIDLAWVRDLIDEAACLIESHEGTPGSRIAPLLVAWASLEAAIRLSLATQYRGSSWSGRSSLIREAATLGLVSRDDVDFLEATFRQRNRAAHGERIARTTSVDVERLLRLARQVLAEGQQAPPSA